MLTRSGVGALLASIVAVLLGWWWQYPELVAVGAALAMLVIVSVTIVRGRQPATVVRTIGDRRIARGSAVAVRYRLNNPTRYRSPPITIIDSLQRESLTGGTGSRAESVRTPVPSLGRLESLVRHAFLPTHRRGVFTVGPAETERLDVFRLAVGRRSDIANDEVIVHPRVFELTGPFGSRFSAADDALRRSSASDPLSGFVTLREYAEGDDPRLIHWPTTARTGVLMLREHVELRRPQFTIAIDASTAVAEPDDFEEMVDVAASLAVHALHTGIDVRVRTTNIDHLGSERALGTDTEILDFLTPVTQDSPDRVVNIANLFAQDGMVGRIALVTGPGGPATPVTDPHSISVVRIGRHAESTQPFETAAETAAEFARSWD